MSCASTNGSLSSTTITVSRSVSERAQLPDVERPGHRDLHEPQAERLPVLALEPEIGERTKHRLMPHPDGHHADPRALWLEPDAVQAHLERVFPHALEPRGEQVVLGFQVRRREQHRGACGSRRR